MNHVAHHVRNTEHHAETAAEAASFIYELTRELAAQAHASSLDTLAYLLEMAALEAANRKSEPSRQA